MNYPLTEQDREIIAKLLPEIAELADRYPSEILNAAENWHESPLPKDYQPRFIDVYCGNESVMFVQDGELRFYSPIPSQRNSVTLTVMIDSNFVYIEVEGKEILNKMGGITLPEIAVEPTTLIIEIAGELS